MHKPRPVFFLVAAICVAVIVGLSVFSITTVLSMIFDADESVSVTSTENVEQTTYVGELLVTGTIYHSVTGDPVPDISVFFERTNIGTQTDLDGEFELSFTSNKERSLALTGQHFSSVPAMPVFPGDNVNIFLEPANASGHELIFPEVIYTPTSDGSTQIAGHVLYADTLAPVAGVTVAGGALPSPGRTDANGYFLDEVETPNVHRYYIASTDEVDSNRLFQVSVVRHHRAEFVLLVE